MLWIWSGAEPAWRQAAVEGTVWNWTLHEASVLSWASCAPWEEGAAAFHTLPHIHCLYSIACVCICVFFNVCVQFLWLKNVFFTLSNFLSNFRMTWESLSSKCIIQIYNDECTQAWLNFGFIYSAVASVRLISFDISWADLSSLSNTECQCNLSLKQSHAWSPLSLGNARLYL